MTNKEALKITNDKIEFYIRVYKLGSPTVKRHSKTPFYKSAETSLEYYEQVKKALLGIQTPSKPQKYPNYVQEINGKQVITYDYKCGKCGNKIYGYYVCCPYCTTMINWVDDETIEQTMNKPID